MAERCSGHCHYIPNTALVCLLLIITLSYSAAIESLNFTSRSINNILAERDYSIEHYPRISGSQNKMENYHHRRKFQKTEHENITYPLTENTGILNYLNNYDRMLKMRNSSHLSPEDYNHIMKVVPNKSDGTADITTECGINFVDVFCWNETVIDTEWLNCTNCTLENFIETHCPGDTDTIHNIESYEQSSHEIQSGSTHSCQRYLPNNDELLKNKILILNETVHCWSQITKLCPSINDLTKKIENIPHGNKIIADALRKKNILRSFMESKWAAFISSENISLHIEPSVVTILNESKPFPPPISLHQSYEPKLPQVNSTTERISSGFNETKIIPPMRLQGYKYFKSISSEPIKVDSKLRKSVKRRHKKNRRYFRSKQDNFVQ